MENSKNNKENETKNTASNKAGSKRSYTRLEFTIEQEEQLIEFVKENPALYDPKDTQYKNKNFRDRLWNEFGNKIEKSGKFSLRHI